MSECSVASGACAVLSSSNCWHTGRLLASGSAMVRGSTAATNGRGMPEIGHKNICGQRQGVRVIELGRCTGCPATVIGSSSQPLTTGKQLPTPRVNGEAGVPPESSCCLRCTASRPSRAAILHASRAPTRGSTVLHGAAAMATGLRGSGVVLAIGSGRMMLRACFQTCTLAPNGHSGGTCELAQLAGCHVLRTHSAPGLRPSCGCRRPGRRAPAKACAPHARAAAARSAAPQQRRTTAAPAPCLRHSRWQGSVSCMMRRGGPLGRALELKSAALWLKLASRQSREVAFPVLSLPGSPTRHVLTAIPSQRTAIAPPASVSSRDDLAIQALRCRGAHDGIQGALLACMHVACLPKVGPCWACQPQTRRAAVVPPPSARRALRPSALRPHRARFLPPPWVCCGVRHGSRLEPVQAEAPGSASCHGPRFRPQNVANVRSKTAS